MAPRGADDSDAAPPDGAYTGPAFGDLDEALQDAFAKCAARDAPNCRAVARAFLRVSHPARAAPPPPRVSYLEERGVDGALAEYLVELSIDKEQREYVNWLKRTAEFVKK